MTDAGSTDAAPASASPRRARSPVRDATRASTATSTPHRTGCAASPGVSWRLLVVVAAVALVFYATVARPAAVHRGVPRARLHRGAAPARRLSWPGSCPAGLATALGDARRASSSSLGLLTYVGLLGRRTSGTDLAEQFSDGIGQITRLPRERAAAVHDHQRPDRRVDRATASSGCRSTPATSPARPPRARARSVEVFTALALAIFCTVFFLARGARDVDVVPQPAARARARDAGSRPAGAGWYTFSGYTRGTVIIAVTDGILAVHPAVDPAACRSPRRSPCSCSSARSSR